MTLHPFLKFHFAVSLQSQNMIFFFSLKVQYGGPKIYFPWYISRYFLDPSLAAVSGV